MLKSRSEKLLAGFLAFILTASLITMGGMVTQSWREHTHFAERERELIETRDSLRLQLASKQEYHERLLTDDSFLEQVVRERLGYVLPDEVVFRFQQQSGGER